MGRSKKYSDSEKKLNREQYERSRGGSLTTYAGQIGNQFSNQVNLLAQVIRDAHEYSLGAYKERLLAKLIARSIPARYAVGTGFVLFPAEKRFIGPPPTDFDPMNRADHEVSLQCDIIVYDEQNFPTIFKDADFVVVPAEAVRAIVEVKGTIDTTAIDSAIDHFIDFGKKWHRCDQFYMERHDPPLHEPALFLMGWQVGINPDGTPKIDPTRFLERISEKYKAEVKPSPELEAFPSLMAAYIYDCCEVTSTISIEEHEMQFGFWKTGGKLQTLSAEGNIQEVGDATIASLLAGIQYSLSTPFNRFISYKGEVKAQSSKPWNQHFRVWLKGAELDFFKWPQRRKN